MLQCSILDPTGNITAIVESPVEIARQPSVAAAIMRRCPEVEQVGFLRMLPEGDPIQAELRMAGGEFCGNASMSAAMLLQSGEGRKDREFALRLRVSGASAPVDLLLRPEADNACLAEIRMPPALGIRETAAAEQAVRRFCAELGADGLGLLFLEGEGSERSMTPLVYVPGSGTCFWENSCASGSAAVGMLLASRAGKREALALREPGGILLVESDPAGRETRLCGRVRLTRRLEIPEEEI